MRMGHPQFIVAFCKVAASAFRESSVFRLVGKFCYTHSLKKIEKRKKPKRNPTS